MIDTLIPPRDLKGKAFRGKVDDFCIKFQDKNKYYI